MSLFPRTHGYNILDISNVIFIHSHLFFSWPISFVYSHKMTLDLKTLFSVLEATRLPWWVRQEKKSVCKVGDLVRSLVWEDPRVKGLALHSHILGALLVAQKIKTFLKYGRPGINPWVRKILLVKGMATHSSILAGEFFGQRGLADNSPRGKKKLEMTKQLALF